MIDKFRGEYRWLSNFHPCSIEYEGLLYPSTEAAYQAAKTTSHDARLPFTKMGPAESKAAGQKLKLRPDWESIKIKVMEDVVRYKFTTDNKLKERLLMTGDEELIERNPYHDVFWGICNDVGENHLGKILIKVRQELKDNV